MPQNKSGWTRLLFGACIGGAAALTYAKLGRPAMLRWGATDNELSGTLPGDELLPDPVSEATRALTILAPAEQVWPWLMQIGQDRGGFYSYTSLENLVGCEMPVVNRIVAEWSDRKQGDLVWMAPPHSYGGSAYMSVGLVEKNRALVLVQPGDAARVASGGTARHGLWSFILEPVSDDSCRLIVRTRAGESPIYGGGPVLQAIFWEPAHFVMERRMMLRIRELAERRFWALRAATPALGT